MNGPGREKGTAMGNILIGSCVAAGFLLLVVFALLIGARRPRLPSLAPVVRFQIPLPVEQVLDRLGKAAEMREEGDFLTGWKAIGRIGVMTDPSVLDPGGYGRIEQKARYPGLAVVWGEENSTSLLFLSARGERSAQDARSFAEQLGRLTGLPMEEMGGEDKAWEEFQKSAPMWFPEFLEAYRFRQNPIGVASARRMAFGVVLELLLSLWAALTVGPDRLGDFLIVALPMGAIGALAGWMFLSFLRVSQAMSRILEADAGVDLRACSVPPWGAILLGALAGAAGVALGAVDPIAGAAYLFFGPAFLIPLLGGLLWKIPESEAVGEGR